jgi:hypothetical protein
MPLTPWNISDPSLGLMSDGKIGQKRIVAGPAAALKSRRRKFNNHMFFGERQQTKRKGASK